MALLVGRIAEVLLECKYVFEAPGRVRLWFGPSTNLNGEEFSELLIEDCDLFLLTLEKMYLAFGVSAIPRDPESRLLYLFGVITSDLVIPLPIDSGRLGLIIVVALLPETIEVSCCSS